MKRLTELLRRIYRRQSLVRLQPGFKRSYSQSGEDMILNTILIHTKMGTYIDVGANNPTIQSNTHFFYLKGWSGINIDALPGSMAKFNKIRPRDTNLEVAISNQEARLKYHMFSSSFYNSFDESSATEHKEKLIKIVEISTSTLKMVLDEHLRNREIDFLSVDVEGLDFEVLCSNDWSRYRPKVILVEHFAYRGQHPTSTSVGQLLSKCGYIFLCNSPTNAFYLDETFFKARFSTA
jgi:FkbM family methyltransferase